MCGYLYASYTHVDEDRSHLQWKRSCWLSVLHSVLASLHALAAGVPVLASCGGEFWVLYPDPGMVSLRLANISRSAASLPMFSVILEMDGGKKTSTQIKPEKVGIGEEDELSAGVAAAFSQPCRQRHVALTAVQADHTLRKGGGREGK